MKKGNVLSNEKRIIGQKKTLENKRLFNNTYNYTTHQFPEENYLSNFRLHHYRYPTRSKPNGIVFFFHDQSSYCGKYAHVAEFLANKDLEVVWFDLPGHGKNKGSTRGYFGTFDSVKENANEFIKSTVEHFGYQDLPKFSVGVSTSWLTTISLAIENERYFNGINIINPLIKNEGTHPKLYRYWDFIGKVWPKWRMMKIDTQAQQSFPDPLLFKGYLRAGLFKEVDDVSYYIRNNASKLTTPLFVAHGGQDSVTTPKTVRSFFDKVDVKDKDIILYDDWGHDIYADSDYFNLLLREQAVWLNSHC